MLVVNGFRSTYATCLPQLDAAALAVMLQREKTARAVSH